MNVLISRAYRVGLGDKYSTTINGCVVFVRRTTKYGNIIIFGVLGVGDDLMSKRIWGLAHETKVQFLHVCRFSELE